MHVSRSEDKRARNGLFAALILSLTFLSGGALWLASGHQGFDVRFGGLGSAALLDTIVERAGLGAAGIVQISEADGPAPEIATQRFRMPAPSDHAIAAITRACSTIPLAPPSAEDLRAEPDKICEGRWRNAHVSVHAVARCAVSCVIDLETRALPF